MIIRSSFRAAWWAKNRHVQTIWGAIFRKIPELPVAERKRLELPDGDFIDVDIYFKTKKPTILLLHGLEGSSDSHYIRGLIDVLREHDFRVVVMHFRGCSGESNRLLQSYHSGISEDLQLVLELLQSIDISVDYLVGFSLGGNVLLKWLGEKHSKHTVKAAVAISVPLLLDECATAIEQGFSKVYSGRLLKTLRQKALLKKMNFGEQMMLSPEKIKKLKSFWEFDNHFTAPVHGFESVENYYTKASSRQFLKNISLPTLVIHAKDDPFMTPNVIPTNEELSTHVIFELAERGGHVGFIEGAAPWSAKYYLEQRIIEFLTSQNVE